MLCFTTFPFFRVPARILMQKKSLHRESITFEQIAIIYIMLTRFYSTKVAICQLFFHVDLTVDISMQSFTYVVITCHVQVNFGM